MEIILTKKISELNLEFKSKFPGLSLSFAQQNHKKFEGSDKDLIIDSETFLGDISANLKEGVINLNPSQLVSEFEQEMKKRFGLYVQINRKSNDLWLQTITTDHWTLGEQNRKGINSKIKNQNS